MCRVVDEGGSIFSYIRQAFLNWDANNSGGIDPEELINVMHSLHVKISNNDADMVVRYYEVFEREQKLWIDYKNIRSIVFLVICF